jgi:hypothetical protein
VQRQRFDRVAGVVGGVLDLAFAPGGGEISGSAAGTDFEVPHLAVQVVWVLAGLNEAVEDPLDLVGGDPQRGLADANSPDLAALDLFIAGRNQSSCAFSYWNVSRWDTFTISWSSHEDFPSRSHSC